MSFTLRCLGAAAAAAMVVVGAGCEREKPAASPAAVNRVLVFGIDGGTWDVMRPMIEAARTVGRRMVSRVDGTLSSTQCNVHIAANIA